jgi:hypothetical protein
MARDVVYHAKFEHLKNKFISQGITHHTRNMFDTRGILIDLGGVVRLADIRPPIMLSGAEFPEPFGAPQQSEGGTTMRHVSKWLPEIVMAQQSNEYTPARLGAAHCAP